jgi:hypothetical protein
MGVPENWPIAPADFVVCAVASISVSLASPPTSKRQEGAFMAGHLAKAHVANNVS